MRKLASIVSIILIVVLLASFCASASVLGETVFTAPDGMNIIYATDLTNGKVPVIDGIIDENEYGKVAKIENDPMKMGEKWPEYIYAVDDASERPSSGTIEFYFAYDENSVYVAFKEYGQTFDDKDPAYTDYAMRDNYGIEYGFDLLDMSNYFLHVVTYGNSCWNKDLRISDGKSSNFSKLSETPDRLYSELYVNKYAAADADLPMDERTIFAYGDLLSASNMNATAPYILEVEMRIDKKQAIELYNELAYTNFADFPNAMYFSMGTHVYRASSQEGGTALQGYARYLATDMRNAKKDSYIDYGILPGAPQQCLPYLIVLGDENTVITIPGDKPETEEITTTKVLPEDIPGTEITTTEAIESDMGHYSEPIAEDEGCGGVVSFAGIALIVILGTCTTVVSKKNDD